MEDEYSLQLQLALLIVSKYHTWTRQKQSSVGRDSCRHCTTHIVWDEESPAAGQIRSGQLETLPSARTYLDGRRVSKAKVWKGKYEQEFAEGYGWRSKPHPTPLEQDISVSPSLNQELPCWYVYYVGPVVQRVAKDLFSNILLFRNPDF